MTPALVTELKRLSDERHLSTPKHHVFLTAMTNHAPALLEAVETMHAALEKVVTVDGQEALYPRGPGIAREALARVAALLGEGRGK